MTLKPRFSKSAVLLIALAAFIAGGILVWFFKPQSNNFAGSYTVNTKTSRPIMKKVIAYKIHLPISADGEPTRGKVEYQLDGETTFRITKALAVSDVAALSSILVNDDVYFDDGLKEFIRTGKPINMGVQP